MAFDQNSVPKDLRPINIGTNLPDEPRISQVAMPGVATSSGVPGGGRNQDYFANPDGSVPMFYPTSVSDAGFVGVGYGNPVPAGVGPWVTIRPGPIGNVNVGVSNPGVGFGYGPNLGSRVVANAVDSVGSAVSGGFVCVPNVANRVGGNGSGEYAGVSVGSSPVLGTQSSGSGVDHASEEGGDDSVSGKKVKFLCSFGGKILPRPSDNVLRYVGGQTRIISVRRDVTFNELVQKMVDTYGQPVIIKYQLPDEDLDALVSVSCPDDLDNMMEEYEKLVERSADGSAKLRLFLFSAGELDAFGMGQFSDLQDSGRRYVDAVNGVVDGVGTCITRKESMTSATSTQNSDFSGTELVDSGGLGGHVDLTGPPSSSVISPKDNSAASLDTTPNLVSLDPNPPAFGDALLATASIPIAKSVPPVTTTSQAEVERSMPIPMQQLQLGYDLHPAGMGLPQATPQLQAYVDPRQDIVNHADYVHPPPQMGFPNAQLLGTSGTVFTQQQIHDGSTIVASQFIPAAVHMTMMPSTSHVAMRPTVVQPLMQPQQTLRYPDESMLGARIVQLPVNPYGGYQPQLAPGTGGGGYGWHNVPQPEEVIFPERSAPQQQVIFSKTALRSDECTMCQKALPHVHSDSAVPDQRETIVSSPSESIPVYHSLQLEDATKTWPGNNVVGTRGLPTGVSDQSAGLQAVVTGPFDHHVGMQQADAIFSQHLEALPNKPINNAQVTHVPIQASEHLLHEPPKEYIGNVPRIASKEKILEFGTDRVRPIEGTMEGLRLGMHEVNAVGEQNKLVVDNSQKEDMLENRIPETVSKEMHLDNPFSIPQMFINQNQTLQPEVLPSSGAVSYLHHSPPLESYELLQPPTLGNTVPYQHLNTGLQPMGESEMFSKEMHLDNPFTKPQMLINPKQALQPEVLPTSSAVSYFHGSPPLESNEFLQPPTLGNTGLYQHAGLQPMGESEASYGSPAFSGIDLTYAVDRNPPVISGGELRFQAKPAASGVEVLSSIGSAPSARAGDVNDASNSLFSNQDPWNLRHDSILLPPKPNKIVPKRGGASGDNDPSSENSLVDTGDLVKDVLVDGISEPLGNSNRDFRPEQVQPSKGSAEEIIKQELQAVAEGVVASVFLSGPTVSDPLVRKRSESTFQINQDKEVPSEVVETQHIAKLEDIKNKASEKVNVGFPISDGYGRLQIIKNSDLEELRELGSGTFGTVYHGKWRGTDVAIKRINERCFAGKPSEQERMIDDFWNEAIKLADLHHPNVVAFYGVVLDGPEGSVATVTEYMVNGSLRNALQKNERSLDKRKRLLIAMDVAFGMEYLHGKNIVHFDLKSDNLLVNLRDPHRPICKVGDLGLSKVKCQTLISGGVRGTLPWMAPELLNGSSSLVSEKVDVFSFGIVMWELLTGEEPYADLHYGAIIGGIVSNTLRPPIPEFCDAEWTSLMERCWSSEPSERPNFTEIANELRAIAAKLPPKGQNLVQPPPSSQPLAQK